MFNWIKTGRVAWIFDDNFVPDDMIAGANLNDEDPDRLKALVMQTYVSNFAEDVQDGDFFVGKKNYGYGRAHEGVTVVMQAMGIGGIIADSFVLEYGTRSANKGYPLILECPGISENVDRWDLLEVDFKNGTVKNLTKEQTLQGLPTPEDLAEMIELGGQEPLLRRYVQETQGL